jgi:hypothetical protein
MAMLTLGSVGDLGATPATAVLSLASVVIYVLPAIVFLLPASLVSAELASGWPGGVYNWPPAQSACSRRANSDTSPQSPTSWRCSPRPRAC